MAVAKLKGRLLAMVVASTLGPCASAGTASGDQHLQPRRPWAQEVLRYRPATAAQIAANHAKADEYARRTHDTIVPAMHKVETPHFLLYSAWDPNQDRALTTILEKMYVKLCQQFNIPPGQNIWAGKCPVYVFWEAEHYRRFTTEVDGTNMAKAGGYAYWSGDGFTYIVLNRVRSKTGFYHILVHEGTHAFVSRYRTNRSIATWANEGLAEYMASTLVKSSYGAKQHVKAAKTAIKENRDISGIFQDVGLNEFDYGIVQGLVRLLIARDRKAFVRFFTLMKEGKSDEQALLEAYGLTREQLVAAWQRAVAAKHR